MTTSAPGTLPGTTGECPVPQMGAWEDPSVTGASGQKVELLEIVTC